MGMAFQGVSQMDAPPFFQTVCHSLAFFEISLIPPSHPVDPTKECRSSSILFQARSRHAVGAVSWRNAGRRFPAQHNRMVSRLFRDVLGHSWSSYSRRTNYCGRHRLYYRYWNVGRCCQSSIFLSSIARTNSDIAGTCCCRKEVLGQRTGIDSVRRRILHFRVRRLAFSILSDCFSVES